MIQVVSLHYLEWWSECVWCHGLALSDSYCSLGQAVELHTHGRTIATVDDGVVMGGAELG